jgi:AraC-like DNA-binding protein
MDLADERLKDRCYAGGGVLVDGTEACCSARILGPFLRMIADRREELDLVPEAFWSASSDARVSLVEARAMLARGADRLQDDFLGLKMGRSMRFGEGGAFDYALRSASTVRESVEIAARFSVLHSDHFRIQFESWRSFGVLRLDDRTWIKQSSDFAMAAFYTLHASRLGRASRVECWFPHGSPRDTSEYQRTFAGAVVKFGAPYHAFAFDLDCLGAPLSASEPPLNHALRAYLEQQLAALAEWNAVSSRVGRFIREQIGASAKVTASRAARALQMNVRTMSRKLEGEGASFTGELERARLDRGLDWVANSDRPFKEVAFLLGFSHVESFHRAFKRWTGRTPSEYRTLARVVRAHPVG